MDDLKLVIAPNPIFKKTADPVNFAEEAAGLPDLIKGLYDVLYRERGLGLAATMVGMLKRIIIVDLAESGRGEPRTYINPEIIWASDEQQEHVEASLCYPGIEAKITRPKKIRVRFQDIEGNIKEEEAEDFLATVIQHEIDYLNGKVYLDYLRPVKRQMLMKKMKKYKKMLADGLITKGGCGHNHAPGESCSHI